MNAQTNNTTNLERNTSSSVNQAFFGGQPRNVLAQSGSQPANPTFLQQQQSSAKSGETFSYGQPLRTDTTKQKFDLYEETVSEQWKDDKGINHTTYQPGGKNTFCNKRFHPYTNQNPNMTLQEVPKKTLLTEIEEIGDVRQRQESHSMYQLNAPQTYEFENQENLTLDEKNQFIMYKSLMQQKETINNIENDLKKFQQMFEYQQVIRRIDVSFSLFLVSQLKRNVINQFEFFTHYSKQTGSNVNLKKQRDNLALTEFDMDQIIEEIKNNFGNFTKKKQSLKIEIFKQLTTAKCFSDPASIRQVLCNYLDFSIMSVNECGNVTIQYSQNVLDSNIIDFEITNSPSTLQSYDQSLNLLVNEALLAKLGPIDQQKITNSQTQIQKISFQIYKQIQNQQAQSPGKQLKSSLTKFDNESIRSKRQSSYQQQILDSEYNIRNKIYESKLVQLLHSTNYQQQQRNTLKQPQIQIKIQDSQQQQQQQEQDSDRRDLIQQ